MFNETMDELTFSAEDKEEAPDSPILFTFKGNKSEFSVMANLNTRFKAQKSERGINLQS